ncbi:MAG: hypothetical protein R3296_00515 [Oleiphilaceae bacterium]|nr:hypothetical protein [Oleiphilaceae bacterium]
MFDELVRRKEALRPAKRRHVWPLSTLAAFTAGIKNTLRRTLSGVGSRQAHRFNDPDYLTGSPAPLFNAIAVNKIVMEACRRSPEVAQYIRAVNKQGRHRITAFENDQLLRILAVLDRHENSASP